MYGRIDPFINKVERMNNVEDKNIEPNARLTRIQNFTQLLSKVKN